MNHLKKLLETIEITNRREKLLKQGDSLVVGVSGGPDSVALLVLLSKLKRKFSLKIHVAHLNHGLNKKDAERYRTLAQKLTERLGFPFYSKLVKVPNLARQLKRTVEETGRIARYDFFDEVAAKTKSQKIATAHTLDDQAETVLMRILRGAGLRGLAGIPVLRAQGQFTIIRPLLGCKKKDILSFLKENKTSYCVDPTNQKLFFTRNRVRQSLLPEIEKFFNPQIKQSLCGLGQICQEAQAFIEEKSLPIFKRCLATRGKNRVILKLNKLKSMPPAIANEVVFQAILALRGDLKRVSFNHLAAIGDLLKSQENNLELHLPNTILIKKNGKVLEFIDTP